MKLPQVPISWGELFDKITILQIKLENLREVNALKNVKLEHDQLCIIYNRNFSENENAKHLISDLKTINQKLWDIEDKIRDKERSKTFNEDFIELARKVYLLNDRRAKIKNKINHISGSMIREIKSYEKY